MRLVEFSPATFGLLTLAIVAVQGPANAQNNPPTDQAGSTATRGTPLAPSTGQSGDGGQRPPTDAAGQTAPAGTPVAPSRIADPSASPSPAPTSRP